MRVRKYDYITGQARPGQEDVGGIHPFHELLYIAAGEIRMKWMGSDYLVKAPALLLLLPNTPHWLEIVSEKSTFGYLELDVQTDDFFPAIDKVVMWNRLQCGEDRESASMEPIYRTMMLLWDILEGAGYAKSVLKEIAILDTKKTLLLISGFLENETKVDPGDALSAEEQVHALMRYMESNYSENITLKLLADFVHLNTSYLIRLFNKITGRTPLGYLQELRMNAAVCFLETTTMSVQQIAEAVGYHSIHYFSRIFKYKHGVSPIKWRSERYSRASGTSMRN